MRGFTAVILFITGMSLVLVSCNSNHFFRETRRIPGGIWNAGQKVTFSVNIPDTSKQYSVYVDIRNNVDYPFANIYLFLDTRFPGGRIARDTIECQLADYDGRWLGSGAGAVKFNRFLFQKGVRFPCKGTYLFTFEQAMRTKDLNGIRDIGLEIEP